MLNSLRKIISFENPLRLLWHRFKGILAALAYGFPGKSMVVIGVTGTNGKTTTTHMIEHILREGGKKVAMLSTADFSINGKKEPNLSKKTTMSPFKTQAFLRRCQREGAEYVVIEASSHALHQSRLWGTAFNISVITNITHEHLDYHGTMEKYAAAKRILFEMVEKNCRRPKSEKLQNIPHQNAFVLNTADEFYKSFKKIHCPVNIEYGLKQGNLQASDPHYSKQGASFTLTYHKDSAKVNLPMMGEYNVENALAATGAALACKLSLSNVAHALKSFEGVEGRMERIKSPRGCEVVVDFALTPDALEKLYGVLRATTTGRLIGLIGSCGDRDKEKRPAMGEIVARHCDLTIVTDEEPYSEDPMAIMEAILEGAKKVKTFGDDLLLIEDRYAAIEEAISRAGEGDTVVLTGMGSFTTRTMNSGPIEWDDRKVAREIIQKNS
ncbi:MAG: UDP-N-acetylmuramoyl-L-alanyl-D-glutamate--2,6-diaminopimelate ligase [Candidatus Peregrinibacteria bacterium]|nr:UDP-N-acetylmuramoyl-L-alanyl-D-glutamate--2,6-diaminopimelate ligase [Candidatus Peregrinibacteria bacterium]